MTRQEWMKQLAVFSVRWPRWSSNLTDEQVDMAANLWFLDLEEFPAEQVEAAITALYRDGREFAPNGAQIRLKVQELATSQLDHGAAYALALQAAGPMGGYHHGGLTWLRKQNPVVAAAVEHYGWHGFCLSDTPDATRRAQFRDIYRETAQSAERHDRYRGIEPAGLKVLEQANDQPTRFGDLVQLENRREIEKGDAA